MSPGSISVGVTTRENICGLAGISVGTGVFAGGVSTDAGPGVFVGDIGTVGISVEADTGAGGHDGVNRGVDAIVGSKVDPVVGDSVDWLQAASDKANAIIVTSSRFPILCFALPSGCVAQ